MYIKYCKIIFYKPLTNQLSNSMIHMSIQTDTNSDPGSTPWVCGPPSNASDVRTSPAMLGTSDSRPRRSEAQRYRAAPWFFKRYQGSTVNMEQNHGL